MAEAVSTIGDWSRAGERRYVCICNAHSVVTATRDRHFMDCLASADLATPDGAPVAWLMRRLGAVNQHRVSGPDLMEEYFDHAAQTGESVFLFGSTSETLNRLQARLAERWPTLGIAGTLSPPFRPMSEDEERHAISTINASGAGTIWISLGCPKQELWMHRHREQVKGVMIGVGAAFDFHAGTLPRAPRWMQRVGLEWLHRFWSEPRRLAKRYLVTNSLFIIGAARQLLWGP